MTTPINQPSEKIAAAQKRWKTNRDMIAGEDAVKAAGILYLPKHSTQTEEDYKTFLPRVPFFPGAARTHEGLVGLVNRKAGVFECPKGMEAVFDTVTKKGQTVAELVEETTSETISTGFTGLLVDHPPLEPGMMLADAEKAGIRPFISIYQAESFISVEVGVVANRQVKTRVVLAEGPSQCRELRLDDGVYSITVHRLIEGAGWVADQPIVPLRQGKPLNEIPFTIVGPKAKMIDPVGGTLDHLCRLNRSLYIAQADAAISRFYSSAPQLVVRGVKKSDLVLGPGTVTFLEGHTSETPQDLEYKEFSGAGQANLENTVATIKDEMAKVGSSILASERSVAEAAETHAIRRSSENSVLASLARTMSGQIREALDLVAWWMGAEKGSVRFELNTDFVPTPMTPDERKALLEELMAGVISQETYWDIMIAGEVLPESFDKEVEAQRIANDSARIDRPTGDPIEPELEAVE